jgi:hypothetical protein
VSYIFTIWGRDYEPGFSLDDLIYCLLTHTTRNYN